MPACRTTLAMQSLTDTNPLKRQFKMKKKRQETFNNTSANVPIIWRAPSFCRGSLCSGGRLRTWTQNTMVGSRTCFLFETTVWRSVAAAVTGETKSSKISVNKRQRFRLFKRTGLLKTECNFKVQIWKKFVNVTSIFVEFSNMCLVIPVQDVT